MKRVCYASYVHVSNVAELLSILNEDEKKQYEDAKAVADTLKVKTVVVKYDRKKKCFTFIESPDWDKSFEPIVGDAYNVKPDGTFKKLKGGTKVYHQKHTFMSPDYKGFDMELSTKRTEIIESIPEMKNNKNRIGNLGYWRNLLKKYNLSVNMDGTN